MAGTSIGACGPHPVGRRDDADRLLGERLQRRAHQVVAGVVGGARRDQDQRLLAGRQLDLGVGDLEGHRPGDLDPGRPAPRVLELGEGRDQRQVGADPAVEALERRQAEPLALPVEVAAPVLEADVQRPRPRLPDPAPERRPRRLQADREERQARLDHRVDVGDQGRQRHPGLLGGEGRGEGEDVADHRVRAHLLEQRQQRPGRLGGVGAVLGVGVGRREHPVFLGGGEAEAGALDGGAALLPGLDRHLVAALGQRPAQRDRREDVAGVAEGGEQQAEALARRRRPPGGARGRRFPRRAG